MLHPLVKIIKNAVNSINKIRINEYEIVPFFNIDLSKHETFFIGAFLVNNILNEEFIYEEILRYCNAMYDFNTEFVVSNKMNINFEIKSATEISYVIFK